MQKQSWKLSEVQKDEICRRYQAGETGPALGKDYGVWASSIHRILHRRGVQPRSGTDAHRRLAVDEAAFDAITEESAYWVGFLMADGSITFQKGCSALIKISLSAKDKAHLYAFRDFLGSEHAVFSWQASVAGKKYPQYQYAVHSDRLGTALAKFGVVPRKSLIAEVKLLENSRHFWRGAVDGDGTVGIYNNMPLLNLVGSEKLMKQFRDFTLCICKHRVHVRPLRSISIVRFCGRYAKAVITHLYADCAIALPRKLAIAQQIMSS